MDYRGLLDVSRTTCENQTAAGLIRAHCCFQQLQTGCATPECIVTAALGDVSVQQVPHGHFRNAKWTPSPPVQRPWIRTTTEPPTASAAAAPAAAATTTPTLW